MDKYAILLGYFDKQLKVIDRLYAEITSSDISIFEMRYVFALKTQQFYTAIEDLLKQIAKAFENHIDKMESFHKELLARMNTEIPNIRPALLSNKSLLLLDKVRAFRHFVRHAYDCELDTQELRIIQNKLKDEFSFVQNDLGIFREFIVTLSQS